MEHEVALPSTHFVIGISLPKVRVGNTTCYHQVKMSKVDEVPKLIREVHTSTAGNSLQFLRELSADGALPEDVEAWLHKHQLASAVQQAVYWWLAYYPQTQIRLKLSYDSEDHEELLIMIAVPAEVDTSQALARLDDFDEQWWWAPDNVLQERALALLI